MIDSLTIQKREEQVLDAIEKTFRFRARHLDKAMRRVGRRLPKDAHRASDLIKDAKLQAENPKLARMIDAGSIGGAFETIERRLGAVNPDERRKSAWLSMLGSQVFNLIVVFGLFVIVLVWRGFL